MCPICTGNDVHHATLNFNTACNSEAGNALPVTDRVIEYRLCTVCGHCFAPEMIAWPLEQFETLVYNADYVRVDPEYVDTRPRTLAEKLLAGFGDFDDRHLDYGAGTGLLSQLLRAGGWDSTAYDPLVNKDTDLGSLGRFDLITAFEVFEHVPHPDSLMDSLKSLLDVDGAIVFSTMLSDGHIQTGNPLDWWYAAPRNGHINLFSRRSLWHLGRVHGFELTSHTEGTHVFHH